MRIVVATCVALVAGVILIGVLLGRGTTMPWLASRLAAEASEALGREIRISKAPYLRIGRSVHVRLGGVQLANAAWAGDETMGELDDAEVVVQTRSLFDDGPLVFERIEIDGLRLRLIRDEQGRSNLPDVLTTAEPKEQPPEASGEDPSGPPAVLRDLIVRNVILKRTNEENGAQQELEITSLTQGEGRSNELVVDANGRLQGRPWSFEGTHSGLRSLIEGRQLSGRADARLDDLALTFDYRLADLRHLEDLVLNAKLTGTPPERVADLSPLLSASEPLLIDAVVKDVDPGISIEVLIDLDETELRISGSADDPDSADGLDMSIDAKVSDLSRLARALDLGPSADVPVTIDGRLKRRGRRFELDNLVVRAGEHSIEGRVLLPQLPGTTDARATLRATGPDFGFYQRLFERPFAINAPYSADVTLNGTDDGRDALEASLAIGATRVRASGVLGDFPSYRNTQLEIIAHVEDLKAIGQSFDLSLPQTTLTVAGNVDVTEAGRILLPAMQAKAAGIEATLQGGIDTYPEFDDIDLELSAVTPSLAQTSRDLQGPALGDVPAALAASIHGAAGTILIDALEADVGSSRLRTVRGGLEITQAGLSSDLRLAVDVESLARLMGDLADTSASLTGGPVDDPSGVAEDEKTTADKFARDQGDAAPDSRLLRDRPFSFEIISDVTPEQVGLTMTNFDGFGIRGEVQWRSNADFAPDESMYLTADLTVDAPAEFLPPVAGYAPPQGALSLQARTTVLPRRIKASLSGAGTELLTAVLIPRSDDEAASLRLSGQGPDLRRFGSVAALPEGALPYLIDATASLDTGRYAIEIADLRVGETQLTGLASWESATESLMAELRIPRAALAAWLPARESAAARPPADTGAGQSSRKRRVIPATRLPVEWLDRGNLDVEITTGPLGLPDPHFPDRSIVESADVHLVRRNRMATLAINELRGSRGNLELSAEAQRIPDGVLLTTDARLERLPIGLMTENLDPDKLPEHQIEARFTGRGSTVRDLATTLDGELLLQGKGGELENVNLSLITESFLEQLVSTLMPILKTDTPSLKVQCSVVGLRAAQGVLKLDPGFVIRTDRVDLSARGIVDLSTERLTIRFDNQARKGLGISAASLVNPYVQITGTLARPQIGLDITNSALAGGAAVATGGLTILAKPLFGRFLRRKSPCDVALERWAKRATEP